MAFHPLRPFFRRLANPGYALGFAALVLSLMVAALAVWQALERRHALDGQMERESHLINIAQGQYLSRNLQAVDLMLAYVNERLAKLDLDSPAGRQQASAMLQGLAATVPVANHINVLDAQGRILVSSRPIPEPAPHYEDRDYFRYQAAGGSAAHIHVDSLIVGRMSHRPVFSTSLRRNGPGGRFLGVLWAGVEIARLDSYFASISPYGESAWALYREDGSRLGGSAERRRPGLPDFLPLAHSGSVDAGPVLTHFHALPDFGLVLGVGIDRTPQLARWRQQVGRDVGVGLTACLLILGLIGQLRRHIRLGESQRAQLVESENLYRELVLNTPAAVLLHQDGRVVFANPPAATLLHAQSPGELIGLELLPDIVHPACRGQVAARIAQLASQPGPMEPQELQYLTRDGRTVDVAANASAVTLNGRPAVLTLAWDLSERKQLEAQLAWQANHDALTGLPNRYLFEDALARALKTAKRKKQRLALLFLDLDNFKHINDNLGHHLGDRLLAATAERLQARVRDSDTVARFGGDEFVVLLPDVGDAGHAEHIATDIRQVFESPVTLGGGDVTVSVSIGISLYPEDGHSATQLLANGDAAMYRAKQAGRNQVAFFDRDTAARLSSRLQMENLLRQALAQGELEVRYQPVVSCASGRTVGAEALLRWNSPVLGAVSPAVFIPVAEDTGLILGLGAWVLRQACTEAAAWPVVPGRALLLAVNVSTRQFEQPDFAARVVEILAATGLPPARLELEITESLLVSDHAQVSQNMARLREQGIRLSVDDFGTGYSSLSYLAHLPVSTLKIDRAFVARLGESTGDTLVHAIIALARGLGLRTVAEGIEEERQYLALRQAGCDDMQGFLFAPALNREAFLERIQADKAET